MNKPLLLLLALLAPAAPALAQSTAPPVRLQAGAVITLPAGASPSALAVADYNQDLRPDIAVCQRGLNSVGVYLQALSGGFPGGPAGTYATGLAPSGLVAVPLGKYPARPTIDLVAVSAPSNAYTLLTNNNNGSGAFTPVVNDRVNPNYFGPGDGLATTQLLARDLDNDGWMDLAYNINPSGPTPLAGLYWQRLETPTRVSARYSRFNTFERPSGLALADFNRDGVMDVVTAYPARNEFMVVIADNLGDGPSWFANVRGERLPSAGIRPVFVTTGDVNTDLLPDIALAHEGSNEITVFLNSRATKFGTPASYPLSAAPRQVLLQDLNDDRIAELLVLTADNKLQVFQNTGAPGLDRFGTPVVYATGADPVAMTVADVDGDYRDDVVVGCAGDNTVRVFLNRSRVLAARAPQLAGVNVYPNPTRDQVTVRRAPTLRGPLTAVLLDALGREVRRFEVAAPATTASVLGLPRGVYILRLSAREGMLNQRLVVE